MFSSGRSDGITFLICFCDYSFVCKLQNIKIVNFHLFSIACSSHNWLNDWSFVLFSFLCLVSYKGDLYIFGGYNARLDRHFNDLWKFNPGNSQLLWPIGGNVSCCYQTPLLSVIPGSVSLLCAYYICFDLPALMTVKPLWRKYSTGGANSCWPTWDSFLMMPSASLIASLSAWALFLVSG